MKQGVRKIHNWSFIILGLPLFLVGLTTFFIAHERTLGLREISIPGGTMDGLAEPPQIRSTARIGGETWIGAMDGVYRLDGARALPLEGSPSDEIRGMTAAGNAVLLAGKKGLWRYEGGATVKLRDADCWQIAADSAGYVAACKDTGLLVSADGVKWDAARIEFPARGTAANGVSLGKIILDIHTGKFFFGDKLKWVWIDLLGLSIVGLALTGFIMWLRGKRVRMAKERRLAANASPPLRAPAPQPARTVSVK